MNNKFREDENGKLVATTPEEQEYQRKLEQKHLRVRPSIFKGHALVNGKYKEIKELTADERIALKDAEAKQLEQKRQEFARRVL